MQCFLLPIVVHPCIGRLLQAGGDMLSMNVLNRIVHGDAEALPSDLGPSVANFVAQCLAKDPHARPTAEELLDHPMCVQGSNVDLAGFLASGGWGPV